jgi:hypothetical protein
MLAGTILAAAVICMPVTYANAATPGEFNAVLSGLNETPETILSQGQGTLSLTLGQNVINYTLTYSGTFSSNITQSHVHFGTEHQTGGVSVFLCTNLGNGPTGTPSCPASAPGTVTGMITAASVLGPTAQGISAGDFDGLVTAITSEAAYANIHTVKFPTGEIRGQIVAGKLKKNP